MGWYRRASIDEIRRRVETLFDDVYGGMPEAFETQRWPNLTEEELREVEQSLLNERERRRIREADETRKREEAEIVERSVPPEILQQFEVKPVFENDVVTRYVWGASQKVQSALANGLAMNDGHSLLPNGWYYLHVGDEEWIAILGRDYGRTGEVCELEISELPEGFFLVEDQDIMDKTNTPYSEILISRVSVIPPRCITMTRVLDTEEVSENYPNTTTATMDIRKDQ